MTLLTRFATALLVTVALTGPGFSQVKPTAGSTGAYAVSNNLSEIAKSAASQIAARFNLGLGSLSTLSSLSGLDGSAVNVTISGTNGSGTSTTQSVAGWVAANAAAAQNALGVAQGAVVKGQVGAESVTANGGSAGLTTSQRAGLRLTPQDFGAKGDCSTDDTAALQAFFNVGGYLPAVPACYKTTNTISVPSNVQVSGGGRAALIKLVLPAGAPAAPVLDLSGSGTQATTGIVLSNFAVDGGNGAKNLATATAYNNNVIAGSAILVQSSYTVLDNMYVANAYDNGISLVQFQSNNAQSNGNPQFVTVSNTQTYNNGYGTGGGAGVDVATGSRATVSNSIDNQSVVGFTFDVGGGAGGSFLNLVSNGAARDGFYVGIGGVSLVNCQAAFPSQHGFWVDSYAQGGGSITGSSSTNSGWEALLLDGSGWEVVGFAAKSAGQNGTHDAIASIATPTTGSISGNEIIGAQVVGTSHRYGYGESATGTGITVTNKIVGGTFQGGTGGIMPGTPTGSVVAPGPVTTGVSTVQRFGDDNAITIASGKYGTYDATISGTNNGSNLSVVNPGGVALKSNGNTNLFAQTNGDVTMGVGGLSTSATSGFPYIPTVAGAPTGTPTSRSGYAPIQFDTSNGKLWVYTGSAWKGVVLQ